MAYVVAADFRLGTLQDYTAGLDLDIQEVSDAQLVSAIARFSERFDSYTDDHFEPENGAVVEVSVGYDMNVLMLPKRTRAVTAVKTRDADGVLTTELATSYRLTSSLNAAGTLAVEMQDYLELTDTKTLVNGRSTWPLGVQAVQVTGNFGWASPPGDIKRALALMVWDNFKPQTDKLRRAERWANDEMSVVMSSTEPTGIPEVDGIIATYARDELIKIA